MRNEEPMNRLLLLTFFWGSVSIAFAKTVGPFADTVFVQRYDTICQGDTLKLFGKFYTKTGKHRHNKPPIKPTQDTTVVINLLVRPRYQNSRFDTLCQGEQLRIGTQQFSSTGTYMIVFPANKLRCDSVIKLQLYILPIYTQRVRVPLCMGDTMRLGTEKYYYPTLATLRYNTKKGCDSIVQYNIEMLDTFRTRKDTIVCKGVKVKVGKNGITASNSGTFYYNFAPNALRCDSLIELKLQVLDTFLTKVQERICQGQIRQLGPSSLKNSGLYRYTFPANQRRCDSTVVLDLKVVPNQELNLKREVCEGDTVRVGGEKVYRTGNYQFNLKTREGCDSIIHLDLKVRSTTRTILSAVICTGDRYHFGVRQLSQPGIYFDTLSSRSSGCDSVIRLDLQVETFERQVINASICQGQSYAFDSKNLRTAGTYVDTLRSSATCPVIFELKLKVNPIFQDTTRATSCQGSAYTFAGKVYTQTGWYTTRLKTSHGCDSIKYLQLRILPSYRDTMRTAICVGDTFRFGQLKFYKQGAYPIRFNTRDGCDSVLVVKLTHYPLNRDTFPVALCAGDTFRLGRLKFHQTGIYPISLRDRNACDSTLYIQVKSNPRYQHSFTQLACTGRILRLGQQVLTRSGKYTETFRSQAGCDSVVTLQLQMEPIDTTVNQGGILLSAAIADNIKRYEWIDCATQRVVSRQSSPFFLPDHNGAYAVRLYTDTCVYTSGCHSIQLSTASRELDFSTQLHFFPNPSSTQLNIQLPDVLTGNYQLSWISSTGQVLSREKRWLNSENHFDTSALPNGLYFLRLQKNDSGEWGLIKFIKAQ